MRKLIFTIIIALLLISCKEDKVVEPALFSVSGIVENENGDKISTDLFLISADTLTTKSKTDGSFIFENITEGEYKLIILPEEYLSLDTVVIVSQNINLTLKLQNKPNLSKPEAPTNFRVESISETEMKILWDDNCDFEDGYKVFRYSGDDKLVYTLPANSNAWADKNMKPDVAPQYKIFAFTNYEQSTSVEIIPRWQYFNFSNKNNIGFISKCEFNYNDELIIAYDNNNLKIVDSENLNQKSLITSDNSISSFAVSDINNHLYYGNESGKIFIYDFDGNSIIDELFYHEFNVEHLAISTNNKLLLSCDTLKIILYNLEDKSIVHEWLLDENKVKDLEFSNSMENILIGKGTKLDKIIELWDLNNFHLVNTCSFSHYGGLELEFSHNDELIAVSTGMSMEGQSFLLKTLDFSKSNNTYHHSVCSKFTNNDEMYLSCNNEDKYTSIQFYKVKDMLSIERNFYDDKIFTTRKFWIDISSDASSFVICGNEGIEKWNLYSEKKWAIYSLD
jgi:hypothetical protein